MHHRTKAGIAVYVEQIDKKNILPIEILFWHYENGRIRGLFQRPIRCYSNDNDFELLNFVTLYLD